MATAAQTKIQPPTKLQPQRPISRAVKTKQQAAWSSGDYAIVGTTLQIVGEELCEALDLRAGQKVLDVAAGNGNVSLAAARRWCNVVSTDYVPALLERGRARATAEGLTIEFKEADAEALPFADGSFDVVVSTFGVMFTPNQERAAAELVRVCKIGRPDRPRQLDPGRLYRPTVQDARQISAAARGRAIAGALGHARPSHRDVRSRIASRSRREPRYFNFRYREPEHFVDVFKTFYGPMLKAFAALDAPKQTALRSDLLALIVRMNKAADNGMVVPSEYLEVVITKR